eukprot:SAG31_NODE_187_length_20848_cov_22.521953_9_plen_214_part_00
MQTVEQELGDGSRPFRPDMLVRDRVLQLLHRGKGCYFLVFCATIREIRDFNREKYGTNRESVSALTANLGADATRLQFAKAELRLRAEQGAQHAKLWHGLPAAAKELLLKGDLLAGHAPAKACRLYHDGIASAIEKAHQSRGFLNVLKLYADAALLLRSDFHVVAGLRQLPTNNARTCVFRRRDHGRTVRGVAFSFLCNYQRNTVLLSRDVAH